MPRAAARVGKEIVEGANIIVGEGGQRRPEFDPTVMRCTGCAR